MTPAQDGLAGLLYALPPEWVVARAADGVTIGSPHRTGRVHLRSLPLPPIATRGIAVLDLVRRVLPGAYPAYVVDEILERPIATGVCIEAEMRPRSGSSLFPGIVLCSVLSEHAVLADFRRPDSSADLDGVVRRLVHGISEKGVTKAAARSFAEELRDRTKYQRREQGQWQVFLCHRSANKPMVRELRDELFDHGVVAWLDEDDIQTGEPFIQRIEEGLSSVDAVAVIRGAQELSSWQQLEAGVAINQFVRRQQAGERPLRIVPVALPDSPPLATWAGFLGTFDGVEFGRSITRSGMAKLIRLVLPDGTARS